MKASNSSVKKSAIGGFTAVTSALNGYSEHNLHMNLIEDPSSVKAAAAYLKENGAKPLLAFSFGVPSSALSSFGCPVLSLDHDNGGKFPPAGVQIFAVSGCKVREIKVSGKLAGFVYSAGGADYALLGGLTPANKTAPEKEQVKETYGIMLKALEEAGMDFSNVARTWFYLDKLLGWYKDFNEVRTAFMKEEGVFRRFSPASTGIGARNAESAALNVCALAVKNAEVVKVDSPLQCEALNYKSAFSRAVEITCGNSKKLMISGTASITPKGVSVHIGDTAKQIEKTMEVVKAILVSRGMDWSDVTRSIVYFKKPEDLPLFRKYCVSAGISVPYVQAFTTVCREELLFEIELDAVTEKH